MNSVEVNKPHKIEEFAWINTKSMEIPLPKGTFRKIVETEAILKHKNTIFGLAKDKNNSQRLGFIKIDLGPNIAEITIFVEKKYRRMGVGRKLFYWALENNKEKRNFYAMVSKQNEIGIAFFEALGFKKMGLGSNGWIRMEFGYEDYT